MRPASGGDEAPAVGVSADTATTTAPPAHTDGQTGGGAGR